MRISFSFNHKSFGLLVVDLKFQARFFFQQLISGVSYCHSMVKRPTSKFSLWKYAWPHILCWFNLIVFLLLQQICHRDLKLENTLLDSSSAPRLKICDFGYSKVNELSRAIMLSRVNFSYSY